MDIENYIKVPFNDATYIPANLATVDQTLKHWLEFVWDTTAIIATVGSVSQIKVKRTFESLWTVVTAHAKHIVPSRNSFASEKTLMLKEVIFVLMFALHHSNWIFFIPGKITHWRDFSVWIFKLSTIQPECLLFTPGLCSLFWADSQNHQGQSTADNEWASCPSAIFSCWHRAC